MKFNELKIGAKFKIAKNGDGLTYTKINNRPHYNVRWKNQTFSIHGNTYVKEIKPWEISF